MKFSLGSILLGLPAIAGVTASPVPASDVASFNDNISRVPHTLAVPDDLEQTANAETNEVAISHQLIFQDPRCECSWALGIIVIDDMINQLPGNHEGINAFYDKLTNIKVNGHVVATHFENGANPFMSAQNAVFDFGTKVVSGVIDLGLDASGTAVRVASSAGIELGNLVVAKVLHIFNDKNQRIETVPV
ncbi:hypothetical protein LB504_012953 [Fusarium proliferatum]|nr:hypothetical protein LB504_012953 [Fusarium proliferatum]